MIHWDKYLPFLWFLCWLFVPITIYSKKYYDSFLLYHFPKYSLLSETKQTKVSIKLIAAVYYLCVFIVASIDLYPYKEAFNGTYRTLTDFEDVAARIGMVLVVSFYVTEITYCHKEMSRFLILHHLSSIAICFCVFEEFSEIEPYVSRFFVVVFALLLTVQWLLYASSVYYHLSSAKNVKSRLYLYILGIMSHIVFTFSQMYCGIQFKINNPDPDEQRKLISLIIFIIFEICIVPTQLLSFYDFYIIITKKILIQETTKKCAATGNHLIKIRLDQLQTQLDLNIPCSFIEYGKSNSYSQNIKIPMQMIQPLPLEESRNSRFARSCPLLGK